ncbi:MAG: sugar transferase [Chloroflexi bacterium]|nr:sugar transferase [Chloroflexota bacterium]MCI0578447.1 sugar transferase [Chloroflexota bacterium]MCI0643893.1 sugar transferase [Chloroflexota bacterium]MCI0729197.1 sugar transferase [Chloroflexota bacterium]
MNNPLGNKAIRDFTILTDLVLFNVGFFLAYVARYQFQWLLPTTFIVPYQDYLSQQILLTFLLIITFSQNKAWRRRRGEFWVDESSRVLYATAAGIALMMALTFLIRPLAFSRLLLAWALVFIFALVSLARLARRSALTTLYLRGIGTDRSLIVGSGEVGRSVIRTLLARPDLGFQAVGYLDEGDSENNIGSGRIPHLGNWTQLEEILCCQPRLHTVFIALPSHLHHHIERLVRVCQRYEVQARVVPDLFQMSLNQVEFNNMAGIPMLSVRDIRLSQSSQALKRLLDLAVVLILAVPGLLVTALVVVAIKLESPGPAFFWQERIGKDGKPFQMVKFRSMIVDAENLKESLLAMNEASGPIFKIRNDPRLTRVGKVIRRLSLDELPQFYNVFKGDMSLVGPRPPLAEEVAQYQPWHRQRLEVRGGITGLWQVSGRSDLTFDEQCLLDIYYIENWSLALDLRIILQTIPYSLFGRGAY